MKGDKYFIDFSNIQMKQGFLSQMGALQGLWEIVMKQRKELRSLNQNAWYWGCIVDAYIKAEKEQGNIYSKDKAHSILAGMFLHDQTIVKGKGGKETLIDLVQSTTELNKMEFAEYCELCRQFLAEYFGVLVPDPDPFYKSK